MHESIFKTIIVIMVDKATNVNNFPDFKIMSLRFFDFMPW